MIFDGHLNVAVTEVDTSENRVYQILGLVTGLPTPQGVLPIPVARLQVPMTKKEAQELSTKLAAAADKLPDEEKKSDIFVAQSLSNVEEVAKMEQKLKGG